jgi:hypothetical protein
MGGISKSWSDEGELDGWQSDMACVFSSWIPPLFPFLCVVSWDGTNQKVACGKEKRLIIGVSKGFPCLSIILDLIQVSLNV